MPFLILKSRLKRDFLLNILLDCFFSDCKSEKTGIQAQNQRLRKTQIKCGLQMINLIEFYCSFNRWE